MSPDVDAIRAYLTAITNPWRELGAAQYLELRCIAEGSQTNVSLFSTNASKRQSKHAVISLLSWTTLWRHSSLELFAKVGPHLCAEGRNECHCYQAGAHGIKTSQD